MKTLCYCIVSTLIIVCASIGIAQSAQTSAPAISVNPAQDATSVTLPNGVQYRDIVIGKGPEPGSTQTLVMHYNLHLANGKEIESSRSRLVPEPLRFTPGRGQVVKGMEAGVKGMRIGGSREIAIPPGVGYGSEPRGKIPGNSTLYFDVELVDAIGPTGNPPL